MYHFSLFIAIVISKAISYTYIGDKMGTTLPKVQSPPVARMTTTFRESYRGMYGPPAPSTK